MVATVANVTVKAGVAALSKRDPCGLPALLQAARGIAALLPAKRLKTFPYSPSF
jgi:hypothetical protein